MSTPVSFSIPSQERQKSALEKPEHWTHVPLFPFPPPALDSSNLRIRRGRAMVSKCNEFSYPLQCSSSRLCACLGVLQPLNWFLEYLLRYFGLYIVVKLVSLWGRRFWGFLFHHLADITPKLSITLAVQNDITLGMLNWIRLFLPVLQRNCYDCCFSSLSAD